LKYCTKCKAPTGIYMKEHRLALCKEHYIEWFETQVTYAIKKYEMFSRKERILLAVSGGKDSLALWQALSRLGYEVNGMYVSLGIQSDHYSEVSKQKCLQMAQKLGRKLHVVDLAQEMEASVDELSEIFGKVCSSCGTVKRYFMNRLSLEENYEVIATGHNLDDEVTTLFGNLMRWDETYLNRQYPVIEARAGLARKVKPLVRVYEKQVAMYAIVSGIDYIRNECPYSADATSMAYKENLGRFEADSPGLMRFFLTNFLKSRKEIRKEQENIELKHCVQCGQPTLNEVCKYCKMKQKVREWRERQEKRKKN